jgi:hypothetical protein
VGIERSVTESLGVVVSSEPDGSYRERILAAHRANETRARDLVNAATRQPGESDAELRTRLMAKAAAFTNPAPPVPPPPAFSAPTKTPAQSAREKIGLVRWITAESARVGSPHHVASREHEFLKSCEMRLNMGETLSNKQEQWLEDIYATAKRKAATISHLLPPTPKFT